MVFRLSSHKNSSISQRDSDPSPIDPHEETSHRCGAAPAVQAIREIVSGNHDRCGEFLFGRCLCSPPGGNGGQRYDPDHNEVDACSPRHGPLQFPASTT